MKNPAKIGQIWKEKPPKKIVIMVTMKIDHQRAAVTDPTNIEGGFSFKLYIFILIPNKLLFLIQMRIQRRDREKDHKKSSKSKHVTSHSSSSHGSVVKYLILTNI